MAEAKWVKFEVNMFDDTKLKIIDSMDKRDLIIYIWTRLLVLAGKTNCGGYLYITYNIAYTIKTLAIEFNRSIDEVKTALKVLKKLEMIEFTEDKAFKIKNWEKHQNVEGLERLRNENNKRVAKCRAKKKEIQIANEEDVTNDVVEIDEINKLIKNNNEEINYKGSNDKVNPVEKDKENTSIIIEEVFEVKDNILDDTNNNCNVTCNDNNSACNVTVMEQNKSKIKIKNKKEIESEDNKIADEINSKGLTHDEDVKESSLFKSEKLKVDKVAIADDINAKAIEIMTYYEKITGVIGGINYGVLRLAIDMHGSKLVKMAINKALEVNQTDMRYINGILKNWRREGYPKDDMEVKINGVRRAGKSNSADKNEFTGFKPKESRKLTEVERKRAEAKLI